MDDNEGGAKEPRNEPNEPNRPPEPSATASTQQTNEQIIIPARKVPAPPHIEFDPDPEELERMNRSMSRQLSVKQLARLSLKHSVSRRGTSAARRAQSMPEVRQESETNRTNAAERPQEQRRSRTLNAPPPQLKFTPLELRRGGPSRSHKLSVIREAKAVEEERKKRAQEVAVRRSLRAQSSLTSPNSTSFQTTPSDSPTPRNAS